MLPLWIIDITEKSSRRDHFVSLVEKIKPVHISCINENSVSDNSEQDTIKSVDGNISPITTEAHEGQIIDNAYVDENSSIKEELDNRDRRLAAKRTNVVGKYWYYSQIDYPYGIEDVTVFDGEDSANGDEMTDEVANQLYEFQEKLVKEGINFSKIKLGML